MLLGQTGEAISELRIALRDSPENEELTILMARAHFAQNNTLSGVEELRSFLTKKSDSVPVRMELAAHYHGQQPEMALNILRDGLAHGNTLQLLVGMGDIEISRGTLWRGREVFSAGRSRRQRCRGPTIASGVSANEKREQVCSPDDFHGAVER